MNQLKHIFDFIDGDIAAETDAGTVLVFFSSIVLSIHVSKRQKHRYEIVSSSEAGAYVCPGS